MLDKKSDRSSRNKGKCQVLHCGRSSPRHHYTLQSWGVCPSVSELENSSAGSSHTALVDNNLTLSQQCAFIP